MTMKEITDTDRVNWLEERPVAAEMHGGIHDGKLTKYWGIAALSGTLREAIDTMIRTGSESQIDVLAELTRESDNN